ncbi:hypothetical protein [Elioraea thermophila]|uniref:hypothetical protein n=1 Tax=Elioraea thermophila TaxID=2185104 RepID=UPI000DF3B5C8|nr:hypothetical protein [Elioraea thermophila]
MSAPRLLARTDLSGLEPITLEGRVVLDAFPRLAARLAALGAEPTLFAEPVLTRGAGGTPTAVAWYGEGEGEPRPLSSLSPARRAEAEARLREALAALRPAFDDAEDGALLRRALVLADLDGILVLDRGIVLTGWGLAPKGTGDDPSRLATLLAQGIGRYLPSLAEPHGPSPENRPPPRPTVAAPVSPLPPSRPPAVTAPVSPSTAATAWGGWWLLPAGVTVAIIFLLLGFWLGWRAAVGEWAGRELLAVVAEETPHRTALEQARAANLELERRIAALRAVLAGDVCRAEGTLPSLEPPREGGSPAEGEAVPAPDPSPPSGR